MEENKKPDYIGNTIVFILLGFLIYAGYLSYKSIDWDVLKRLEAQPLILPTPIPASPSAQIASPSSTSL
jgi:hypothetical protein